MAEMSKEQTSDVLGKLSKKYFTLKEENHALDNLKKDNNKIIEETQLQIIEIMESEGLEKFGTEYGSLTRKIDLHPSIQDFVEFINWVFKTKAFEFLQKRANAAPIREMLKDSNTLPPGIDTYEKETLLSRIKPEFRTELENNKRG